MASDQSPSSTPSLKSTEAPQANGYVKEDELYFEPAEVLRELNAMDDGGERPSVLPSKLPISRIILKTVLFQPREINERHIQELRRSIKAHGALDPITVINVGGTNILIDGHHRIAAYVESKVTAAVPVNYFKGTLEEAVLESGKANSKAKLPMTSSERQEYAWRLVLLGATYSKKNIREASGVSDGQVANMRRVKRQLGDAAFQARNWWAAWIAHKGQTDDFTGIDDDWIEAQANEYADRLSKEFGTKLANNTTIAARALEIHFGRRIGELAFELQDYLSDEDPFLFDKEDTGDPDF
ncbi:ParB/RepB/Spo0J family partition protein [Thalassospiraceae bacterium LMO-JJ14]|nr:ParB/RepB/Spo0J family partition protein [Thalassospiraceae bacterium LMO-JJ14]